LLALKFCRYLIDRKGAKNTRSSARTELARILSVYTPANWEDLINLILRVQAIFAEATYYGNKEVGPYSLEYYRARICNFFCVTEFLV
jgi:hypothetical protein